MLFRLILIIPALFLSGGLLAGAGAPPQTPIDGGLSILLAGGALYGVKKIRDYKRM